MFVTVAVWKKDQVQMIFKIKIQLCWRSRSNRSETGKDLKLSIVLCQSFKKNNLSMSSRLIIEINANDKK